MADGINPFVYASLNPINALDPFGLFDIPMEGPRSMPWPKTAPIVATPFVIGSGIVTGIVFGMPTEVADGTLPPSFWDEIGSECPDTEDLPDFNWNDPSENPVGKDGEEWEWRGKPPQGGPYGGYKNPNGPESLHPDLGHDAPPGPHWDYNDRKGPGWRVFPDGSIKPK